MTKKELKLNIKNAQLAEALQLGKLKEKLAEKIELPAESKEEPKKKTPATPANSKAKSKPETNLPQKPAVESSDLIQKTEEAPRRRARSRSVFAKTAEPETTKITTNEQAEEPQIATPTEQEVTLEQTASVEEPVIVQKPIETTAVVEPVAKIEAKKESEAVEKLGPTGRRIEDLYPKEKPKEETEESKDEKSKEKVKGKPKGKKDEVPTTQNESESFKKGVKPKFREFKDLKPAKRSTDSKSFDVRKVEGDDEGAVWRRKRTNKSRRKIEEPVTIRPTSLKVRIPISIKDLAAEMKVKASELIATLFLQGMVVTINDLLDDETTIQLLGHEHGCAISIDTSEEERLRITDQTIKAEIQSAPQDILKPRSPVVAFMGHVDHGKTSLIDSIRKSKLASQEAGAITQHIGAFRCSTKVGSITVLDTPGHEAFSAMRARGADVTDIVVLVVAGDEGIQAQTVEAIQHAKSAGVTIVVALNKCDKPTFNPDNVYRQLAEQELLPEAWGGQTITVNCSALTGEGIEALLEMLALQAEVLELKANPQTRARGTVLESQLHKGMGIVATILVQNGTLRLGDSLVCGEIYGRVKTMQNEFKAELKEALPSSPVEITGLSGLPQAGDEFVVVKNEREAKEISEGRKLGQKQVLMMKKNKVTMENFLQQAPVVKKTFNVILRADVQGSLEALKVALLKIQSDKVEINIIFTGVGEVTESDVQLAATSNALIVGFHSKIESHADSLVKQYGVKVRLHEIIYHAVDDVKQLMTDQLEKIAQEADTGKVEVKAIFKSSHYGNIAGCQVIEGTIHRNNHIRIKRQGEIVWKGSITSLKRVKDDVREVSKGQECGIVLNGYNNVQIGDIMEAYEVTYITQEL